MQKGSVSTLSFRTAQSSFIFFSIVEFVGFAKFKVQLTPTWFLSGDKVDATELLSENAQNALS